MTEGAPHIPVLLAPVMAALQPVVGGVFVDGTFGAGGYTRALIAGGAARVVGIDRDPTAVARGRALEAEVGAHFAIAEGTFSEMETLTASEDRIDGVVLDIGVSSMQLDEAERGFSFRTDGPLDMRMSIAGASAADLVNETDERGIARILQVYGEERQAGRIARAIVRRRSEAPLTRTRDLVAAVESVLGGKRFGEAHPATRTFQAIRIAVNDELGELVEALAAAERLLPEGGRLAVVTFHSLEDRIVKRFFADRTRTTRRVRGTWPRWRCPQRPSASRPSNRSSRTRRSARPTRAPARPSCASRSAPPRPPAPSTETPSAFPPPHPNAGGRARDPYRQHPAGRLMVLSAAAVYDMKYEAELAAERVKKSSATSTASARR